MSDRPTQTLLGNKARKAVLDGVNAIYEPVRRTLGPQAKKALLYRTYNRGSRIVDDGKTVSEVQEPKNMFARLAAAAFKETCKKTDERVGDGTTTTAVIGGVLMNEGYKLLSDGVSDFTATKKGKVGVTTLKHNILNSAAKVKDKIKEVAKPVSTLEELEKIATISVEDSEVGKVIAKMAWEVGVDGFIDVVEGYKGEIETEIIKGHRFPAKVPAKAFVNNPARFELVATDCPIFITNYALDNAVDLAEALRGLNSKQGGVSKLIIIAPSFSENVLVNAVNATKNGFFIYPVNAPALRTEQFDDLATYCGAKFFDKSKGHSIKNVTVKDLGFLEKLVVKDTETREDAIATGGRGALTEIKNKLEGEEIKAESVSAVSARIEVLKGQLKETQQESFKKLLERRIASMASAVGVIRVGDTTQASSLYRKLKIEDAVYACKAALRGGYVKGGGICLRDVAEILDNDDILKTALVAPYEQIQASVDGGIEIGDDVIDPAETMYYAVEHATSVVANLLTVEIITIEEEDVNPGDGYIAIAKMIGEYVISQKIQLGQITANQAEMERDRLGGMTEEEKIMLDNG